MKLRTLVLLTLVPACLSTPTFSQDGGLFDFGKKPAPTAEDSWAIRCLALRNDDRHRIIEDYAGALRKMRGLDARLVTVVHDERESTLFYGRFRRVLNTATGKEEYQPSPLEKLNLIRSLNVQNTKLQPSDPNNWPFRFATLAPLPAGKSDHPEWDLENAAGYWSLQVGVFYNSDEMRERKTAAVQYCALLREQGTEAYYHHGPDKSSVCVGIFMPDAVRETQKPDPLTGILQVSYEVTDARLIAFQRQFPHNLENGHKVSLRKKDPSAPGGIRLLPNPSFIVRLPKAARERLQTGG